MSSAVASARMPPAGAAPPAQEKTKYKLIRKIGAGTFGTAYLCCLRADDRQMFVVKKIKLKGLSKADTDDAVKVKNAKKPENHLPPAYFPEDQIWAWFIQLTAAVKHAQDRKVIHRDIKTANIFLGKNPGSNQYVVKLGDFGISKVLAGTHDLAKTNVGTPYYMAPELCDNQKYCGKVDIWAMGVVLYELTTLKTPFDAKNFDALSLKILMGKYAPIPSHYSQDLATHIKDYKHQKPRQGEVAPSKAAPMPRRASEKGPEAFQAEVLSDGDEKEDEDKFTLYGATMKLPGGVGKGDAPMQRMEALRCLLEDKLGDTVFLKVYNMMNAIGKADDEEAIEKELIHEVGMENIEYLNVIAQLIFCEDRNQLSNQKCDSVAA
ncbi:kinase-like domain-containing protein [Baffinella frigidus]|nr:kinase-like domain-containing protein [Cryptophyta sp. CCMP2293]